MIRSPGARWACGTRRRSRGRAAAPSSGSWTAGPTGSTRAAGVVPDAASCRGGRLGDGAVAYVSAQRSSNQPTRNATPARPPPVVRGRALLGKRWPQGRDEGATSAVPRSGCPGVLRGGAARARGGRGRRRGSGPARAVRRPPPRARRLRRFGLELEQRGGQGDGRGDPRPGRRREATRIPCRVASRDTTGAAASTPTVDLGRFGEERVRGGEAGLVHADPPVSTVISYRDRAGIAPPADGDGRVGGENRTAFSVSSASRWVTSVTERRRRAALRDLERPRSRSSSRRSPPHDVAQRDRLAPHHAAASPGEDEQVLGVAAHPRGEVVQAEQLGERVRVALRLLEWLMISSCR